MNSRVEFSIVTAVYGIYSFILFLAFLFYAPVYCFRLKASRGRLSLGQRLGLRVTARTSGKPSLWIHAVSVGEVLSLRNLISQAKKHHPGWEIHFSTLTTTGYQVAKDKLKEADSVFFIPLDFSWVVKKFLAALNPSVLVLAESEFWPNLLRMAKKSGRQVLLVNGRMSERSYRSYLRLKPLVRRVLGKIDYFMVQTEPDRKKLEAIGVSPQKIEVSGNLKCEVNLPPLRPEERAAMRRKLGLSEERKIVIAGSTHKGEEELLLEAFQEARREREDLTFIIAPRHPERAAEVLRMAEKFKLKAERRTRVEPGQAWDVLILDTIGELTQFYALSDLAFVGGSLVPKGGQNLLEPVFYAKPVVFGPHMENFAFLAEEFVRRQAARVIRSKEELVEAFRMREERELREAGERAKKYLDSLQGVTARTLQVIEDLMSGSGPPQHPSSS